MDIMTNTLISSAEPRLATATVNQVLAGKAILIG